MFNLIVENKEVELSSDAQITLSISNPAFDPELINRIFSLSLKAQLTPGNVSIFGQLDRLDLKIRKRKHSAQLIIGKTVNINGVVKVQRATSFSLTRNNSIEINFQSSGVDFFDRMNDVLWESILPSIPARLSAPSEYHVLAVNGSAGTQFRIIINGVEFIEIVKRNPDPLNQGLSYIEAVDDLAVAINTEFPGIAEAVTGQAPAGASTEYYWRWIKIRTDIIEITQIECFDSLILSYPGDTPVENQQQFLDYITARIEQPKDEFAFCTIYNPSFFGESNPFNPLPETALPGKFTGLINPYKNFLYANQVKTDSQKHFEYTYTPFLRIKYLFQKALKAAGYFEKMQGDFWTSQYIFDSDPAPLILYDNTGLDEFATVLNDGNLNVGKKFINLSDHINADNAKELFIAFCNFFQAYIDVEGDTVSLIGIKDQIEAPPFDFTDIIEDDVAITSESYSGYELNYAPDSTVFTEKENQPPNLSTENAEITIETEANTLGNRPIQMPTSFQFPDFFLPYIKQLGNSPAANVSNGNSTLKFLIDYGRKLDNDNNLVSFATSDNIMPDGTVVDDFTLLWPGPKGLQEQFWGIIPDLLTGREITVKAKLKEAIINDILKWKSSAVIIRSPKGQIKAYIKEVNLTVTRRDIRPATVVLSVPTTS